MSCWFLDWTSGLRKVVKNLNSSSKLRPKTRRLDQGEGKKRKNPLNPEDKFNLKLVNNTKQACNC